MSFVRTYFDFLTHKFKNLNHMVCHKTLHMIVAKNQLLNSHLVPDHTQNYKSTLHQTISTFLPFSK